MNATEYAVELSAHLAAPDPDDFGDHRRGHVLTQAGDPQRFEMLAWLPNVYVQIVRQAREDERLS